MTIILSRWGNSLGMRLPKRELHRLGLKEGSEVSIIPTDNGFLIEQIKKDIVDFNHLLTAKQISTLSKAQYDAYISGLSQYEKEEIWRRQDGDDKIPNEFFKKIEVEAEKYFSSK